MASPDLTLRLNQTRATVPTAEARQGLEYVGHTGSSLTLVSGLPVANALGYDGFGNDVYVNNAIKAASGGLVPQTLSTAVYENIHLVAGTKLVINTIFTPGDTVHNDEAFTLLKNLSTGDLTPVSIANVNVVKAKGTQNFTVTYTIGATSNYNLMVGVADIGDKLRPSSLTVTGLSVVVPGGQYSVLPTGLQLADSSLLRSDGSLALGGTILPSALSNSGAALVAGLTSELANKLIGQDGGGLISQDGGGVISHDGGGLISQDGGGLISQDGGGVVSNDGASLISQDGGGLISQDGGGFTAAQLAQIGASLAANNGAQLRAFAAASSAGLTGHNYGLMSLDGSTTPVPDTTVPSTNAAPVPGLEVTASESAAASRYDDSSAIADLGGGRYVVAFAETVRDPDTGARTYAIRAQVLNADGTDSGAELTVSPPLPGTTAYGTPANQVQSPSVASLGGGSFVVAWENGNNVRPAQYGFSTGADLFAQIVNADGSLRGGPIALDPQTTNAQYTDVKVTALTGGGFVAVWGQQAGTTNSLSSIHGKLFNADGTQRGNEFSINGSSLLADLRHPAVSARSDGGFALSFDGKLTDPSTGTVITGIAAQIFDASGAATSRNPAIVAFSDSDTLTQSSLATLPNGNIAIAWVDSVGVGASPSLYSLVLNASLVPLETEPTLITGSSSQYYGAPTVTALNDGRFVVGYTDFAASVYSVQGQIMSADNVPVGARFALYAPGGGDAVTNPALLQLSTGALLATSTHKFYTLPASDVRAIPISVGGSAAATATSAQHAQTSGSAVHGYVAGGTVFADANGNGVRDAGEAAATTTADGAFALPPGATGPLVLTGGTDLATGKAFTGRYTAPDGSPTIDALTTLVQGVLARGGDVGTAQMKVATALGMSADAALTDLDPMTAASQGATGRAVLLANALVADMADLATAAGSADALGAFAASVAANAGFTAFDPSSAAAMASAGLSGQTLTDAAAIAASVKSLLLAEATADGSDAAKLASDVNRLEVVVQGAATAFASALGTGSTASVAAAYTGDALQSKFDNATPVSGGSGGSSGSTSISGGTVGVYRFFDSRFGTHFFTGSADERNTILATRPDLVNEGVGLQSIDPASKDPNAAPVFRFFDTKFGTHFFTASTSERDQVLASRPDLSFEGTGFYEHTAQQSGDIPVYRFFDKNFGTHFYTADSGERATIVATRSDLIDEGIGFYAPKTAT